MLRHHDVAAGEGSRRVGCAKRECPALTYQSTIVCDYGPGGNISGTKPY